MEEEDMMEINQDLQQMEIIIIQGEEIIKMMKILKTKREKEKGNHPRLKVKTKKRMKSVNNQ